MNPLHALALLVGVAVVAAAGLYLLGSAIGVQIYQGKDHHGRNRRKRLRSHSWKAVGLVTVTVLVYGYGSVHDWW